MSRLTRDGTAEPVSRDQILRHARGQGNVYFPCSADHEQDWQPYPVDPYSAICDDHTYIPFVAVSRSVDTAAVLVCCRTAEVIVGCSTAVVVVSFGTAVVIVCCITAVAIVCCNTAVVVKVSRHPEFLPCDFVHPSDFQNLIKQ